MVNIFNNLKEITDKELLAESFENKRVSVEDLEIKNVLQITNACSIFCQYSFTKKHFKIISRLPLL